MRFLLLLLLFIVVSVTQPRLVGAQTISPGISVSPEPTEVDVTPTAQPTPTNQPTPTSDPTPTTNPEVTSLNVEEIEGEVLRVNQNEVTIQTATETLAITIPNDVRITKDGREATLAEIQPGDTATILQTTQGEVLAVSVQTGPAINAEDNTFWWWIIGGAITLAILYFLISQRNRKGHIKSSND